MNHLLNERRTALENGSLALLNVITITRLHCIITLDEMRFNGNPLHQFTHHLIPTDKLPHPFDYHRYDKHQKIL